MLIILFGPSCSGKSSVAEIIKERTGATVITGKDYLRLAKNPSSAREKFLEMMTLASKIKEIDHSGLIYVLTDSPDSIPELSRMEFVWKIHLSADIETLEKRFAPRTGGKVPPPVLQMLKRSIEKMESIQSDLTFNTAKQTPQKIADCILTKN